MSQQNVIMEFLKARWREHPEDPWAWSYELIKVRTPYGWLGSEGDRRARELRDTGLIIAERKGKYERYRYNENYGIIRENVTETKPSSPQNLDNESRSRVAGLFPSNISR